MKKKNINFTSLTEEIFGFFRENESYSEFVRRFYNLPSHHRVIKKLVVGRTISRMKKQGWLEAKKRNDQVYYRLTAKGKIKKLALDLRRQKKQRGEQATIVIFDVPEEKKNFRDFLRRLLLQNSFTFLQKSVFISPYILPQEFYELLSELDLLPFVTVIEGKIRVKK